MDYQKFLDQICQEIKHALPEHLKNVEVELAEAQKINGVLLDGVIINANNDRPAPHIYLQRYFDEYENGKSIDAIAKDIAAFYLTLEANAMEKIPQDLRDYKQIKEQVIVQLVNKDMNQELLATHPHKDLENTDLAAIFRIRLTLNKEGQATTRIGNELLNRWGISAEELYQDALTNSIRDEPARVGRLEDVIFSIFDEDRSDWQLPEQVTIHPHEQYILSNPSGISGAAALIYPEVLQQLAENANANLFILPSSQHEVILMVDTGEISPEEMQSMVISINASEVSREDLLSNGVYCYDKDEHSLYLATDREQTEKLLREFAENDFELDQEDDLFQDR